MIFVLFFLGGRWFSKILCNIWGWYVKILTIPYRGGWVVWKRPKTPLRNIKMAPWALMEQTTTPDTTPSNNLQYSFREPSGDQIERQEKNFNPGFNPAFNPTINPAAIEMPPNPEYEARNRFPSSFQANTYGANNHMTPSSNLPYSLTPGEANGNQKGSEPAYAGGWVNQSYKHTE